MKVDFGTALYLASIIALWFYLRQFILVDQPRLEINNSRVVIDLDITNVKYDDVIVRNYTCEYKADNLTNCHELLNPHIEKKPAWFFLDLFYSMKYPYSVSKVHKTTNGRCGFLEYCTLHRASKWVPPLKSRNLTHPGNQTQGPLEYGLTH